MANSKQKILLTGATGRMGQAVLDQLSLYPDLFEIQVFSLDTPQDRRILKPYLHRGIKAVWGDLVNYQDVLRGVSGADLVLHLGGLVSPLADKVPKLTMQVNLGGTRNVVRAIQSQPDPDQVRLVYIGTVAQTGHRPPPIHWGRVGDPIKISHFDAYSLSKTLAEQAVIESGLKHWVSLRQTGILRMATTEPLDPITFHTTLNGVLEWISPLDSGRLLAQICRSDLPASFWREIYNIGGGESNRLTNLELFEKMLGATGIRDFREVLEPHWFATRNFHGQWFADSDRLEDLVPYRSQSFEDYLEGESASIPWFIRLAGSIPRLVRKQFEAVARGPGGTLTWLVQGREDKIRAYFGSLRAWEAIPGWDEFSSQTHSRKPDLLDHGFDRAADPQQISAKEIQDAARFRGGSLLSREIRRGDWKSLLTWQCHQGHKFSASLNLILKGGHWCPVCVSNPDNYPHLARASSFFRQVWEPESAFGAV